MGDRANVEIKDSNGSIFLYTHWGGSELKNTVKHALRRRQRWNDGQYLARIIFCEMIGKDNWDGETGFGISATIHNGEEKIIIVDVPNQTVNGTAFEVWI